MKHCLLPLALLATVASAQVDHWELVADPFRAFLPHRVESREIYPLPWNSAVWKDERYVISGRRTYFDSAKSEYYNECIILESRDSGATWSKIGVFTGFPSFNTEPLMYVTYSPGGDVMVGYTANHLRYNRETDRWEENFKAAPGAAVGVPKFRDGKPFFVIMTSNRSDQSPIGYFTSEDDGRTLQEVPAPKFLGALDDETQFGAGWRMLKGRTIPDVNYVLLKSETDGIRGEPFYSQSLGLVFHGRFHGDDNARTWESHPTSKDHVERFGYRTIENGTFVCHIAKHTSNLGYKHWQCATSSDMGRTWQASDVDDNREPINTTSSVGCSSYYFTAEPSGEIYRAIPTPTMSQALRWPADADSNRSWAQTMICPAPIIGEIRLQLSTNAGMTNVVLDTVSATRHVLFSQAAGSTTYHWRYAWRQSSTQEWSAWSDVWTWRTGTLAFFSYLGDNEPKATKPPLATILMNGTIVRIFPLSRRITTSVDGGASWDSIGVIPGSDVLQRLWESPKGRLLVSTAQRTLDVDVLTGTTEVVRNAPLPNHVNSSAVELYGAVGSAAVRSTDDGRTWKVLHDFFGGISGVSFDPDGNVLFALGYRLNQAPPPQGYSMLGGLQLYNVTTNTFAALSPNSLSTSDENAVGYQGLIRLRGGELAIYEHSQHPEGLRTSRDGKTWPLMPLDLRPPGGVGRMFTDRDGAWLVSDNATPMHRQRDDGGWEKFNDGYTMRDADFRSSLNDESFHQARDGSIVLSGSWLQTTDASFRKLRPQHRGIVRPGTVTLAWNAMDGAVRYETELMPEGRLSSSAEPQLTLQNVAAGAHTWRVRFIKADGTVSGWSASAVFTAEGPTSVDNEEESRTRVVQTQALSLSREMFLEWIGTSAPVIRDLRGRVVPAIDLECGLYTLVRGNTAFVVLIAN